MPKQKRFKTKYPGVYSIMGNAVGSNKQEKIYYIMYRKDGKLIEEKAGRQYQDDMTPARAASLRARRIEGGLSNRERRKQERDQQAAEENRWTLGRLWAAYRETKPDLKGLAQDESRWRRFIESKFADKEPSEVAPLDLDRLRLSLLKKYSPQHVKHVLALIRRIIRFGYSKGLCNSLSFEITMPSVDNQVTEDLNQEQLAKLLEAIEVDYHPHAGTMMKLALFTGMRKSEMLRLEWDHIDFKNGFVRLVNPKGGKEAIIPLNDLARDLLQNHSFTEGSSYVFPGRDGKQRREIRRPIERIRKAADLPKGFRPLHGLRHVYASTLASSGQVDLYTLQKLLTHKSPNMTQRYAHLRDDSLKKASNLINHLVDSNKVYNKSIKQ